MNLPRNINPDIVDLLLTKLGTHKMKHHEGSFYEHLVGTYHLLKKWGNSEEVCLAGLFHSIYGTQYFKKKTVHLSARKNIQSLIGKKAEYLAFLFCTCDRSQFGVNFSRPTRFYVVSLMTGKKLSITRAVFKNLLEIELANFLDQNRADESFTDSDRESVFLAWCQGRKLLTKKGYAALLKYAKPRLKVA